MNKIFNEDCLDGMKRIPDKSIDMILCDLPYGVTKNKWDSIIPLNLLWEQYERVIKDKGAIVLTSQDKFTSMLVVSNVNIHKYNLIWEKSRPTGFLNAKKMPLRSHEDICVFYKKLPTYNPQFSYGLPNNTNTPKGGIRQSNNNYGEMKHTVDVKTNKKYPKSVLKFDSMNPKELIHPTQKPVALFEYLIKTYTNEGETILDNCMGSGTTAIACMNTNRNFIGFELDKDYHEKANQRIASHKLLPQ